MQEMLIKPITQWLKPVSYELEEMTMPICIRHGVPYRALSLSSFLSISDLEIKVDAKDVFAVEELTWMIDTIISILIGLLCGGSGVALISGGISGVIAGQTLEKEKNLEITERLVGEISEQIEQCLTKMAEVVEIPLG